MGRCLSVVKSKWSGPNGDYNERMIPVRIACTRDQIIEIMDMTKEYYDQIAVCAYKISEECIIR